MHIVKVQQLWIKNFNSVACNYLLTLWSYILPCSMFQISHMCILLNYDSSICSCIVFRLPARFSAGVCLL